MKLKFKSIFQRIFPVSAANKVRNMPHFIPKWGSRLMMGGKSDREKIVAYVESYVDFLYLTLRSPSQIEIFVSQIDLFANHIETKI